MRRAWRLLEAAKQLPPTCAAAGLNLSGWAALLPARGAAGPLADAAATLRSHVAAGRGLAAAAAAAAAAAVEPTGLSLGSVTRHSSLSWGEFEKEFETAADHPSESDWGDGFEIDKEALLRGKSIFDGCATLEEMRERLRLKILLLEQLEADGFRLNGTVQGDYAFLFNPRPPPPAARRAPDTWEDVEDSE